MMLKWQPSTNLRLEVLCDELQMNAGMHFRQLHQVRQDCVVVEKKFQVYFRKSAASG